MAAAQLNGTATWGTPSGVVEDWTEFCSTSPPWFLRTLAVRSAAAFPDWPQKYRCQIDEIPFTADGNLFMKDFLVAISDRMDDDVLQAFLTGAQAELQTSKNILMRWKWRYALPMSCLKG